MAWLNAAPLSSKSLRGNVVLGHHAEASNVIMLIWIKAAAL